MKNAPKLAEKKNAPHDGDEGARVDAYVGRDALRQCGGVYVISRRDGMVKVGITAEDFSRRFKEVEQASRSAGIVGLRPEILVPMDENMAAVESKVHNQLSAKREGGEWFRASAKDAVNAVLSAALHQRLHNAKHRKFIEVGAMGERQESAEHPSFEEVAEAALSVAECIDSAGSRAGALAAVAEAQAKAGNGKASRRIFKTALSAARNINKNLPVDARARAYALCDIARAQAEAGDIDAAFSTAQGINHMGIGDRELARITQLRAAASGVRTPLDIVLEQAESGNIDGAAFFAISNEASPAWAMRGIAVAKAKAGDIDGALSLARDFSRLDDDESHAWALRGIAKAQAEAGDIDGALATAFKINADGADWAALRDLRAGALRDIFAQALAKPDGIDGAFAVRNINDPSSHTEALRGIAEAQAESGDIEGAFSTARGIDMASARAGALRGIAEAQAKLEDFRGAMKTALEIDNLDNRARALAAIAKHLAAREKK